MNETPRRWAPGRIRASGSSCSPVPTAHLPPERGGQRYVTALGAALVQRCNRSSGRYPWIAVVLVIAGCTTPNDTTSPRPRRLGPLGCFAAMTLVGAALAAVGGANVR